MVRISFIQMRCPEGPFATTWVESGWLDINWPFFSLFFFLLQRTGMRITKFWVAVLLMFVAASLDEHVS